MTKAHSWEQGWTCGPQKESNVVVGSTEEEASALTLLFSHQAGGNKISSCWRPAAKGKISREDLFFWCISGHQTGCSGGQDDSHVLSLWGLQDKQAKRKPENQRCCTNEGTASLGSSPFTLKMWLRAPNTTGNKHKMWERLNTTKGIFYGNSLKYGGKLCSERPSGRSGMSTTLPYLHQQFQWSSGRIRRNSPFLPVRIWLSWWWDRRTPKLMTFRTNQC